MNQILIFTTVLAPILTALTSLIKSTVNIPTNFIPAVSLGVGILIGAAAYPFTDMDLILRLWAGALAGLGGTGIYEVFKDRK
ncbi:holin [Bacillus massiliglaciei]|uniref:holin n=1 Tax=Bacillus massiliglaciei TaxID=1816693 RepID=UPI000DA5F21B|nr:holin [Bacillus massiliglaciei]